MPIRYEIKSEMDLLLYVFEGVVSMTEYFDFYRKTYLDERRHHGMKILADLINCEPDFAASDFEKSIKIMRENRNAGYPPDHLALIVSKSSLEYFVNAMKLLADDLPVHLSVFYNIYDAIKWLGLEDQKEETVRFWETFKQNQNIG